MTIILAIPAIEIKIPIKIESGKFKSKDFLNQTAQKKENQEANYVHNK